MHTKSFPGRYESLAEIAEFVKELASAAGLSSFDIYAVETAVDEACSNIIEHGYQGEGIGEIYVSVEVMDSGLKIILHDHGRPFDPDAVPDPDLNASIEERASHGLGLYFMRRLMDEVHFSFTTDRGNTLTLVKNKEKKTG
ncbi:MAG: ATP-binding protein [Anaerolineaceae bacterium]|jgi:anti-sigma regulatory factor (Ser/Thr protein kinase)